VDEETFAEWSQTRAVRDAGTLEYGIHNRNTVSLNNRNLAFRGQTFFLRKVNLGSTTASHSKMELNFCNVTLKIQERRR
jgi:hypothetical protein